MNEQIKNISLAVIAVSLVVQTIIQIATLGGGSNENATPAEAQMTNQPNQPPQMQANKQQSPQIQAKQANQQKQNKPQLPKTTVKFSKQSHDFGTIPQQKKVNHKFTFTNTGDKPLVINNARGSCGCTVPEYPKKPIPPGESDEIVVEYNSGKRKGMQRNTVTINANTDPSPIKLQISAKVDPNAAK